MGKKTGVLLASLPVNKPFGEIYCVTSSLDGCQYVGQTVRGAETRWREHRWAKDMLLGRAIRKHGMQHFSMKVLDTASSREELDAKEILWIAKMGSLFPAGFNLTIGGNAGVTYSEESRRKMSLSQKGRKHPPEVREKISAAGRGRKMSPEHKEVLREFARNKTPEFREMLRNRNRQRANDPVWLAAVTEGQRKRRERERLEKSLAPG